MSERGLLKVLHILKCQLELVIEELQNEEHKPIRDLAESVGNIAIDLEDISKIMEKGERK